jgi:uncharacterized protein (DUF1015 family)
MHIEPFQAVYPRLEYITAIDSFFGAIKAEYNEYNEGGFFKKANREALYIYRIRRIGRTYTGIIACTDIRDFLDGNIRKHEHTLAAKEQKQLQLMLRRKAAVKPVLLTYDAVPAINEFIADYMQRKKPFLDLMLDEEQTQHTLWKIKSEESIHFLQQQFEQHVSHTYIADGHHRTSTSALMYHRHLNGKLNGDFHLLLCALFTTENIDIQSFNRVVSGFGELSAAGFMARIAQYFDIDILTAAEWPRQKHELTMYVHQEWYRLRWKPEVLNEYENEAAVLDAAVLDDKVLKGILGIQDVRTDQRIKYVEGPKGLGVMEKYTDKEKDAVAFSLYPIHLSEIIKVADASKVLPPKSTWFEPRMKNGLIVQEF